MPSLNPQGDYLSENAILTLPSFFFFIIGLAKWAPQITKKK
jgi:Na+-transporting NADH:ubiquinone oxidoreductase subunit NqrD